MSVTSNAVSQDNARPSPAEGALVPVADGLWTVDAAPIRAGGLPLPLRMAVVRLGNGDLLLYSPTRFSPALKADVERLGTVRHIVAPNVGHWLFLKTWQENCPGATTWAAPGLAHRRQVRDAGLRVDAELGDVAPPDWRGEIDQVLFQAPGFSEVALFHRPSRTLLVADLILNLDRTRMPPLSRVAATALRIAAPDGSTPVYLRALLLLNARRNRAAAARLVALAPARVIPAHGVPFAGGPRLRRALAWIGTAPRDFDGTTVVVTGASSGIGRATAVAFAGRGAQVVLAARREDVLTEVARECAAVGGRALVVPTDVTVAAEVEELATRAVAAFGGVDVWVNNAGVGVFGPLTQADVALHRRTIEVNLIGSLNGAAAVLPIFLRRGRGTLINNISLGGWVPTPFAAAYTASKFGLRGFTASLRQELTQHRDIHVCGVFPSIVDTPGFVHGANVSGRNLDPGPFQYAAEDVADTIVRVAKRPRNETAVGWPARAGQLAYALAPAPTEVGMSAVFRLLLSRAKAAPHSEGALLTPIAAGTRSGGDWLARKGLPSARWVTAGAVAAGAIGLSAVLVARVNARPAARRRRR